MTKVTIILEGEMTELAQVLGKIGELKVSKQATILGGESEWIEERVLKVWWDLSEKCKEALQGIAQNKDMSWEKLQEQLGRSANEIGGSLSSLGATLKKYGLNGITHPLGWDEEIGGHTMLPIWREVILKLIKNKKESGGG